MSTFESNIPGCTTGTVVDSAGGPRFTPWGGLFARVKGFNCANSDGGAIVRVNARFSAMGRTGSWTVIDGWGSLEDVKASGFLVGMITGIGADDRYIGAAS